MSRIRLLSEHLTNQIAAGEVVERPASVVKELLENSLDAHASRIFIQIEGNGTRLIRIRDNGEGMDSDDVLLSIERHATSKIQNEQQLNSITTLGFRGEALPSIGSVSNLIILSRLQGNATGTKADIRYGRLHKIHEDGCAQGTIIEIRNLFGNVPARRKFLKSTRTELYHIEEIVRNLALAHPNIEFQLQENQRTVLHMMPSDLEKRVREIFKYQKDLLPIKHLPEQADHIKLEGYLLLPDSHSSSRTNRLRTLVNGRPVVDNMVRKAVSEGLQGFIMKGQQPAGALLLTINPEQIDINVHPAKREIRFRNAQAVFHFFQQATSYTLSKYQDTVRDTLFTTQATPEASEINTNIPEPLPTKTIEEKPVPEQENLSDLPQLSKPPKQQYKKFIEPLLSNTVTEPEPGAPIQQSPAAGKTNDTTTGEMTLIGQLFNLYLLYEKNGQMIVIDQHAAHERIIYQQLLNGYLNNKMAGQNLMFPVSVELLPNQIDTIEKYPEELVSLGLTVQHFGDATWIIKSVPAIISHLKAEEILIEIINSLQGGQGRKTSGSVPKKIDAILSSMACKAAVKGGNKLETEEMSGLLSLMQESDFFSHCPHGRPVVKVIDKKDIEKWFHRL